MDRIRDACKQTSRAATVAFSNKEEDFEEWGTNMMEYMHQVRGTITSAVLLNAATAGTYLNINDEEALDWIKFKERFFRTDEDELDDNYEEYDYE